MYLMRKPGTMQWELSSIYMRGNCSKYDRQISKYDTDIIQYSPSEGYVSQSDATSSLKWLKCGYVIRDNPRIIHG